MGSQLVVARRILQTQAAWHGLTVRPSHIVAIAVSMSVHVLLLLSVGFSENAVSSVGTNLSGRAAVILVSLSSAARAPASNDPVPFPVVAPTFNAPSYVHTSTPGEVDIPSTPALLEPHLVSPTSLIPIIQHDAAQYFRSQDLSERPLILNKALLDNTPLLLTDVPSQIAVLRFLINEHGNIDQVLVDDSRFSPRAERLIIEAFSKLEFNAGKIGDLPVKSQLRIEIKVQNDGELQE
jgi:hypothetical protein